MMTSFPTQLLHLLGGCIERLRSEHPKEIAAAVKALVAKWKAVVASCVSTPKKNSRAA
jgi:hypothetical protein